MQSIGDDVSDARRSSRSPLHVAFGSFANWDIRIRQSLHPRYAAAFVDLETADLDAYDAVAPLRREHYQTLLERRPDLYGRKFILPSHPVSTLCHDKLTLTHFLIEKGFGAFTPALRKPGPPYPYVWKRRTGGFGLGCHVVMGPSDEAKIDSDDQNGFAQELAPGATEFATHVLRGGRAIRYLSTVIHQMPSPAVILGNLQQPQTSQLRPGAPFRALFAAILDALDYEGTACIDYKIVAGRPQIFEINPRFGASLSADVSTYLDAYLAALGQGARVAAA